MATSVVNDKVKPLLNIEDDLYMPGDLEVRVNSLEICVNKRKLPSPENVCQVITDYIAVYFPTSLKDLVITGTVDDLLCAGEGVGKKHRCRVCQWEIPQTVGYHKYLTHLKKSSDLKKRLCNRRTKCLLQCLADMELKTDPINSILHQPRRLKRKRAPSKEPAEDDESDSDENLLDDNEDGSVCVPAGPVMLILSQLHVNVITTYTVLHSVYPNSARKSKGILFRQESVLNELILLVLAAMGKQLPLDEAALVKLKEVHNLQFDLVPMLKKTARGLKNILAQGKRIADLMDHFSEANGTRTKKPVASVAASVQLSSENYRQSKGKSLPSEVEANEDESDSDVENGGSIAIPAGPAYNYFTEVFYDNMKIQFMLDKQFLGSAAKAKEIVFKQDVAITALKAKLTEALKGNVPVGVEQVLSKVREINSLQYELVPLLTKLGRISKRLIAQGKAISNLTNQCIEDALLLCPQDATAAAVSSTATNTRSCTPGTPGTHGSGRV